MPHLYTIFAPNASGLITQEKSNRCALLSYPTTADFIVPDDDTDTTNNPDTSQSYVFSSFQYTAVGVAVSQSYGVFRQPLYRAYLLCLVFLAQFGMNSAMLLG